MDRYLDFTLDSKFSALPDMIKDLHAHDQRYVIIVVPGTFVSFCALCLISCFSLTVVSALRIRASAARSPRAPTGHMRMD